MNSKVGVKGIAEYVPAVRGQGFISLAHSGTAASAADGDGAVLADGATLGLTWIDGDETTDGAADGAASEVAALGVPAAPPQPTKSSAVVTEEPRKRTTGCIAGIQVSLTAGHGSAGAQRAGEARSGTSDLASWTR